MNKAKMNKAKYRIGQVVKFKTTLRSFGKQEQIFCQIINSYYDEFTQQLRYKMKEYPYESEYSWDVPENMLNSVSLMEM